GALRAALRQWLAVLPDLHVADAFKVCPLDDARTEAKRTRKVDVVKFSNGVAVVDDIDIFDDDIPPVPVDGARLGRDGRGGDAECQYADEQYQPGFGA